MRESSPEFWESIFFSGGIDKVIRPVGIQPLRETPLSIHETEVRVWRGFGLTWLEGVILKRSQNRWTAVHIKETGFNPSESERTELREPKSGWDHFWRHLNELGLYQMEPANADLCYGKSLDGTGIVVEISQGGRYRTYMYPLGLPGCKNSSEMVSISDYIGEEFDDGLTSCTTGEWFPCARLEKEQRLNGDKRIE